MEVDGWLKVLFFVSPLAAGAAGGGIAYGTITMRQAVYDTQNREIVAQLGQLRQQISDSQRATEGRFSAFSEYQRVNDTRVQALEGTVSAFAIQLTRFDERQQAGNKTLSQVREDQVLLLDRLNLRRGKRLTTSE